MSTALDSRACECGHSEAAHQLNGTLACAFCRCSRWRSPRGSAPILSLSRHAMLAVQRMSSSGDFEHISRVALLAFAQEGRGRLFAPESFLMRQGEHSQLLYILLSGHVAVERIDIPLDPNESPADPELLATLGPGEVVGELAALTGAPRSANVVAQGPVETLELNSSKLHDVFDQYPEVLTALGNILASRMHDTDEIVERTVDLALRNSVPEQAVVRREGIDPERLLEIRAYWNELKQQDLAEGRAREALRQAIRRQLARVSPKPRR